MQIGHVWNHLYLGICSFNCSVVGISMMLSATTYLFTSMIASRVWPSMFRSWRTICVTCLKQGSVQKRKNKRIFERFLLINIIENLKSLTYGYLVPPKTNSNHRELVRLSSKLWFFIMLSGYSYSPEMAEWRLQLFIGTASQQGLPVSLPVYKNLS